MTDPCALGTTVLHLSILLGAIVQLLMIRKLLNGKKP
jgi:hypothetical protein